MRDRWRRSLLMLGLVLLWPAMASADALNDGRQALRKGDIRSAVIELRNAVRADPQNAEAHFLLAKVQLELGEMTAAEKHARNAMARGYDKQQVLPLLISTYLLQGKFVEALADFQIENKDAAIDSTILTARGYAYTGLNKLDDAEKAFDAATALTPNALQPALASVRLALTRGNFDAAQRKLIQAERIAPNSIEVQLLKTQTMRSRNDAAGALALLDKIIAQQPGALKALSDRASLYLALGRDKDAKADNDAILALKPNDVQGIFMQALLLARARDFTTADAQLDRLSRFLGRLPRAYFLQAVIKQNLGQLEQAEDSAMRYVAREPGDLAGVKLLARIQLLKRKPTQVIELLNRVAALGRMDFELYDLLGRAYSLDGQSSEAVEAFRSAQSLAPDNVGVNTRLARAHMQVGENDAAIVDLERSLTLAPGDKAVSEQLFVAAMTTGDLSRADEVLGRIKASLGEIPTVGNLEAVLLMARLDLGAARVKLEEVIRQSPDFMIAQFNLARLALLEGKNDEANQLLADILRKKPSYDPALRMYVGSLVGGGKIPQAIEVLERARADSPNNKRFTVLLSDLFVRAGDARKALALLGGDTKASLLPVDLLGARARAQQALGQVKDARDTYMELINQDPGNASVRRTVAGLMVGIGEVESARNVLLDGLKIDPQAFPLMQDLVAVDFRAGGVGPALRTAERFERLNSSFAPAQALGGDVHMAALQWDAAISAYTQALENVANPPTMLVIRLATALNASGNVKQADQVLQDWMKTHPDDVGALQFLAELNMKQKRYADAEQRFLQLLEKRPRDPAFLNNLAWLYQQRGDKRARTVAQQAYVLSPVAEIADTLGWILVDEGDYRTALILLRQANGEANKDPRIGYHYAVALQKTGRTDEAIQILRPIVNGDRIFDERAEATKFLGDLRKGS